MEIKQVAVLGQSNIEKYSMSPLIHNRFFKENKINGIYSAIPVLPENLYAILKKLYNENYIGVNLTIPHKINVIKYLDEIDETAKNIGAVNTILFKNGKFIGYNTDTFGFINHLENKFANWKNNDKVLVIGAGGASRSILYGLKNNGIKNIIIVNRTLEKAKILAKEFDCEYDNFDNINIILKNRNLIINATSLGMINNQDLELNFSQSNKNTIVYDIVYNPLLTKFLKNAQANDLRIINGLGMLLFQAAKAFEIWFNIFPKLNKGIYEKN